MSVETSTLCNEGTLLVERSQQTKWESFDFFWFITSFLGHQLPGMGNFFLKCSLLVRDLAMCNEFLFGVSLAQPTHCCSEGMENCTEVVSWNFQDVTKHSK